LKNTSRSDDGRNLFTWTPSKRVLIVPPARCRWIVAQIVDELERLCSSRARDEFWRRRCVEFERHLRRCGASQADADRMLDDLFDACEGEQRRRSYEGGV